ncbi:oxidoreductase, 2-nitropropane dioxygenase family protein [Brevibacterium mcbrellneri ATCC 49030]|uniref:Propionate 3-nitronate monooxygenase n=1 Tax=Brevibacterium mcbrellneri ATCC 49030 TaxID=585530 RepID=D4YR72_9MICO|nr:nitronate monooxygenase [Brevibacterium mcbrellneri]EFG46323.1 oxidoreductase, 2-nitropropane dioxygenase family protein [Brevibacterium mcbrellneri ATCC 49030]
MDVLDTLSVPIMCAPMAGGPSTPELAAAVTNAGGLGSIAAGYLSPEDFEQVLAQTRELTDTFNANLFVPETVRPDTDDLKRYASALQREFGEAVDVPEFNDDHFSDKIDLVLEHTPEVVTFTFGLPDPSTIRSIQSNGSYVGVTVTSSVEAVASVEAGAEFLIVQSTDAGGHLSVHRQDRAGTQRVLPDLVQEVRRKVSVPLIAAGGIGTVRQAQQALDAGAQAVSLGTRFLTAGEAGTKPAHADALVSGEFTRTVQTRAFSGRIARGLANTFTSAMEAEQIVGYPHVHYMTSPIRKAHAHDPQMLNLWAGTGFAHCATQSAVDIVREFSALRADRTHG